MNIRKLLKRWLPPIIADAARALVNPPPPAVKTSGIQEIECLGLHWRLDMASVISRSLVTTGIWERDTTNLVLDFVKPGMQVLAVGANFGYYALLMAKRVGSGGHVWAFEPTKQFREQLKWHVEANGFVDRITILPFGLSDSARSATIDLTPQSASMHCPPNEIRIGTETIFLKPLDSVTTELGIRKIDFISMDIDGHEAAFLRGAKQTLIRDIPPIAMEFSQSHLHLAGSDVRDVAALLREIGYDICSEKTRKPYKDEMEFLIECGNFNSYSNALAIPRATVKGEQ